MMITTDGMDDSLITRRQKEIKALKEQVEKLIDEVTSLKVDLKRQEEINVALRTENKELKDQLLIYEHDPIIYEEHLNGFAIKVWNTDTNQYKIFAQFYDVGFEEDLEEFCSEFVLELKDAYMV